MGFWTRLTGKVTKDDFAALMIEQLRMMGETRPIQYDPLEFKLDIGDGDFFLHNAYANYSNAGRGMRRAVLQQYAGSAGFADVQLPESYDAALPNLLPAVRSLAYHGVNALRIQAKGREAARTPYLSLASHLAVSLVYDTPRTIRTITEGDLSAWSVSLDDALDQAKETLLRMSAERFETLASGVYRSPWRDNHDASRLFLSDLIWSLDVAGDYIAAVPDRDTLLITGSQDLEGLEYLAQLCEESFQQGRALSGIPVTLRDGGWITFEPEPDHPLYERFKAIRISEQSSHYSEQKTLLDEWNERNGEDLFVASYSVVRNNQTGVLSSYSVWGEGIPTLLPETEEIAFVRGEGPFLGRCDWKRAAAEFGELMKLMDLEPRRVRVVDFPPIDRLIAVLNS